MVSVDVPSREGRFMSSLIRRRGMTGLLPVLACLSLPLLAAARVRAQQATTQFDGSYSGMPKPDKANRSPPCVAPQIAFLDVHNGNARMRSSIDRRKGVVQPDGSVTMRGELVVGSQHVPGFVEGKFTADGFEGVSRFPQVNCAYTWKLPKTRS